MQKKLSFAIKGESFLEFKREQIIFQIKRTWADSMKHRRLFLNLYKEALIKLNKTYKEMGKSRVDLISRLSQIQYKPSINVQYVKKIGMIVPKIKYELVHEEKLPAYTFDDTSHHIDDLIIILKDLFASMLDFSESEDLMLKHSLNFKKINRRINGLKNIIIPKLELNIKQIKDILEELDREGFVRLKKTKDLILKKTTEIA